MKWNFFRRCFSVALFSFWYCRMRNLGKFMQGHICLGEVWRHVTMVALFLDDNKINNDGDGKENGKKWYVYINKQQLCTCITLFCTFLCRRCTTTTWNKTNIQHKNCRFLFLNLGNNRYSPKENFAMICQIKWYWIRSVKFEILWIDFQVTFSVCCYPKILLP